MGLLTWILVGLVAGFIAQLLLGGGPGGLGLRGLVITTLGGVAGALIGLRRVQLGYSMSPASPSARSSSPCSARSPCSSSSGPSSRERVAA